ncbi:Na+/H+ antiporter subunit E [Fontimonas sp. SYSU GA230001]|uniref:Na+/H+ antiporter subunit E n=1 Tax=Fontimonas sp. SYSU GA230001 TaxID=3142450 RepID=UPI0032B33AC1
MKAVLGMAVMLSAFWLLLSGHYAPLFLFFGAVSVALAIWLARRMDIIDHEGRPLEMSLRAPRYWAWLGGQILLSALRLARMIWTPDLRIAPTLRTTPIGAMTELERVTYANSITLTPGTLALQVEDEWIEVHSVDETLIGELERGDMAARIRRMELG